MSNIHFVFFGTSHRAVFVLEELFAADFIPTLIITIPDRPKGRSLNVEESDVKKWAITHSVELLQPEKLDSHVLKNSRVSECDIGIVVDYGKILPKELLDIPRKGFLNVHPSLLPRLRGPSPIRSAILNDEKNTGVTIMQVDEELDHGPIVAQKSVSTLEWPPHLEELEETLLRAGGKLLAQVLPHWVADEIEAHPQNHDIATFSEILTKQDGLLDLEDDAYTNLLKIRAFEGWPGTYTSFERKGKTIRVQILDAHVDGKKLVIDTVKPEGKKAMRFAEFERGRK